MSEIKSFSFSKDSFDEIKAYKFGRNWPVVYIAENGNEVYIGETINAYYRSKQHYDNPERRKLKTIHILTDEEFNKSAALDIESWLIQYISADQKFILQNGNGGLKNHNYYDRAKYKAKFEIAWDKLREKGIVKNTLNDLKNSDLFKYSPYKSLTEDQFFVAKQIFKQIKSTPTNTFLVNGKPGTGKSILATYLFKYLKEQEETKNLNIVLVVPMTSLRKTIQKVFRKIKGLSSSMVVGPAEVIKNSYDIVIVDEAHRLRRPVNIPNLGAHYANNIKLGIDKKSGTELDWIIKLSKHQIFFYDQNQSVKPSDIKRDDFRNLNAKEFTLKSQMRVEAGEEFIQFIDDIFDLKKPISTKFPNYDFKIFDDVTSMIDSIKIKDKEYKLARVVAGYAWPWHTKPGTKSVQKHDIDIDGLELVWNSTAQDWVNSSNAINEVGCIHTVQGYDLNYVGVIIGPEFTYDKVNRKFKVDKKKYFDRNGHAGITDPSELERYVINIYKTLLTRGIKGAYVYIVNEDLRDYIKGLFASTQDLPKVQFKQEIIKSPYQGEVVRIPLVGSAPCGNPLLGKENIEEYIDVPKNKIRPGAKYFIVRADGDSMNKAGINDGDIVLCRFAEKGETGDKVVALLGGENVTIKYYDKKDGLRILLPKSTNPKHQPIIPEEGDSVQGIVQEVIK
jgi:uncharacterized protein